MRSLSRRLLVSALVFVAGLLFVQLFHARTLQAHGSDVHLPTGFFYETFASGLDLPVDMEFLPNGDLLVAEKGTGSETDGIASIRLVWRDGSVKPEPVLTVETDPRGDKGIQGLILDPNYAENHHFYLWYSTRGGADPSVYRLSRFTFDPETETAPPESEVVVIEGIATGDLHHGGGLGFDDAGNLYIATGDALEYDPAQDLSSLNGKVLRVRPTDGGHEIPSSNPFVGVPDARDEIYALGLRNPFRMTKNSEDGTLLLADVGYYAWEEINEVAAGANYGWPHREGPCPIAQWLPCAPAPAEYTDPVVYYAHSEDLTQGASVTGLTVYNDDRFPAEYHGALFFADYNLRYIAAVSPDAGHLDNVPAVYFAEHTGPIVDLETFDGALYVLNLGGTISRIAYTGPYEVPGAQLSVTPTLGAAPLEVTLSGAGSTAPDDGDLTYHWDFGDGSAPAETSSPVVTHSYQEDGNYTARLYVTDAEDTRSSTKQVDITVYSGELPRLELTNTTSPTRSLYHGGDRIRYEAVRDAGTAGLDPDRPYSWRIDFHHNQHVHPILVGENVNSGTFEVPIEHHDESSAQWYSFHLTMYAQVDGNIVEVQREASLYPDTETITITTSPYRDVPVTVNVVERRSPYTYTAILGVENALRAQRVFFRDGDVYTFSHWTDQPAGVREYSFHASRSALTHTAHYTYAGPAKQRYFPVFAGSATD